MRGRGPRGAADQGSLLHPIAWGEVEWNVGVPSWRLAGGEFGVIAPASAGPGPVTTALVLTRHHDPARLHIQVSSQASGYAYEEPSLRQPNGCIVFTPDAATPFAVLVLEG